MVRRNLTGAGYGLTSWLEQRITAIIMLIVVIAFLLFAVIIEFKVNSSISSWQALLQNPFSKIIAQVFFISLLLHAWVGIRDLWMDYIKSNAFRLTLYILTILWLIASFIYSIQVIWA